MRRFSNGRDAAKAFGRERGGNFAVLTAAIAPALALAVGFGVNTAQIYHIKANLGYALDAAVTSTARDLTVGRIEARHARARVEAFLGANGDPESLGERLVLDELIVDPATSTVEATAHVVADLYFPLFSTGAKQHIRSISAALYSDKQIEVAMMLDVTGSMKRSGGVDKIGDLRNAAANAVELLLAGQNPKKPRVRVAIVPYAEAVNTGKLVDAVFQETSGGSDLPPPMAEAMPASAASRPDRCATERKESTGAADFSDDGPYTRRHDRKGRVYLARVNRDDRLQVCPKAELVALTSDREKLLDAIGDFRADGVTAGGIAAQWGYYMLSPEWRRAVIDAGMGAGPADFDPRKVAKVAILMTDGQFNTAFAGVSDGRSPQLQQGAKARSHAEALCANMKKDGIEIFTIGFDLDNPGMSRTEREQAKSVLKNCSSKDAGSITHYFEASTGEELDAAFRAIIANTERLAIIR